jgi:hypothetical protein
MREIANQAHRLIPRGQDEAGVLFRVTRSEHGLYARQKLLPVLEEYDPLAYWQMIVASDLDRQVQVCPKQLLVRPEVEIILAQINLRVGK